MNLIIFKKLFSRFSSWSNTWENDAIMSGIEKWTLFCYDSKTQSRALTVSLITTQPYLNRSKTDFIKAKGVLLMTGNLRFFKNSFKINILILPSVVTTTY